MFAPPPYIIKGTPYDLSHMAGFKENTQIKLRGGHERRTELQVQFSCHCWSRQPVENEVIPDSHFVYDGSEEMPRHRIFSEHRHGLSLALPGIMKNLIQTNGHVRYTKKDNILRMDLVAPIVAGTPVTDYYVFIKPKKVMPDGQKKYISLFVESAYPESVMYDTPHLGKPKAINELLGDCWEGRFPK